MNKYIHPLQQHYVKNPVPSPTKQPKNTTDFKDILSKFTNVKISKHAANRLEERNIEIDEAKWTEIASKMTEAKQKGVTDALVVFDDVALIANTKNHTIITALDQNEAKAKIFTNINGTIVL